VKAVAETLEVARSHLHDKVRHSTKPRRPYRKPDDALMPLVRRLVDERPTYGYRRITALANRERARAGEPAVNHKRVFRIMRQNGMLLARHTVAGPAVSTMARSSSCARTCVGAQMASRLVAGTATSSVSPSSLMPMTERLSPGMPSWALASAVAWSAT
jgi:hypothetical protein